MSSAGCSLRSRYVSILVVLAVCLIALPWSLGEGLRDDTVIAMVNGRSVKYGDVKLRPDADILLMRFRQRHGRDPESEADKEEMQHARRAYEIVNLAEYLRAAVRREQVARFGVAPTAQEIEERWVQWLAEREREGESFDPSQRTRQMRSFLRELAAAYKEVMDESRDPDTVYRERFLDVMSYKEWQMRIQYDATAERRRSLERVLALPDSELFNPHDAGRKILIMEETMEAVEEELIRTDPEFAEYMRLARTDPRNEKVQSKGPDYKAAKRHEWWQQRYREAKIEIKDERFRDALKELLK